MADYNGWSNWETWVVNLYFGDMFQELSEEYRPEEWDSDILKAVVEEMLEAEGTPTTGSIVAEFVNGCMSAVRWYELACHYVPVAEEDEEDEEISPEGLVNE